MVKNHTTTVVYTCKNLHVTTPVQLGNGFTLCFNARHSLPTFTVDRTLGGELLTLPHNNVTFLCTTTNDSSPWIVLDGYDLILVDLSFEGRLC